MPRDLKEAQGSAPVTSLSFCPEREPQDSGLFIYPFPKRIFLFPLVHSAVASSPKAVSLPSVLTTMI